MELTEDIRLRLAKHKRGLDAVSKAVNDLSTVLTSSNQSKLDTRQKISTKMVYSHVVLTLLQEYKKVAALNESDFQMSKEEERVKQYSKKVKKALAAEALKRDRLSISLDIAAANRFITHAIPDLSEDQRQQLKTMNIRSKGQTNKVAAAPKKPQTVVDFIEELLPS